MKYVYRLGYRVLMLYWFVCRPRTQGVKCLLQHHDQILLVRHTYGRGFWTLPGGGLKRAEALETAVRREVREELGMRITDVQKVSEFHSTREFKNDTAHCFTARTQGTTITRDTKEIAAAQWFRLDALPSPRSEILEYTLTVTQALAPVSPLADETAKSAAELPAS